MSLAITRRAALRAGGAAVVGVPAARAQGRRVVRAVMSAPLAILDPHVTTIYVTRNHGYQVFDTLFALDAASRPQPQMVAAWSVSPDGLTYLFRLRAGLRFHDGSPVTAADAVASLRRWMAIDLLGARLLAVTDGLDAPDELSIRLVLKRPYGLVLETLAKPNGPVPFIMPRRLAETPPTTRITEMVGSGPFRFVASEYRPGDRTVYERFDGYAARPEPPSGLAGSKAAYLDRVEWMELADAQTASNALIRNEIQLIEGLPPDQMPLLRRTNGVVLKLRGIGSTLLMRLNSAQAPFNNRAVRQAVMAGVRQADYLDAQIGEAELQEPCGSILSCQSPYAAETPGPAGDLARARTLLRQSGYAGEPVVILHAADMVSGTALAPLTEQLLRAMGMNVRIDTLDWNSLVARRARNVPVEQGGWSIAWGIWSNIDLMDPVNNVNLDGRGARGYAGWADSPEMERLRDAFALETDATRRQAIAAALQRLSNTEAFTIPLGGYKVVTAHRSSLSNLVADQLPVFWGMRLA